MSPSAESLRRLRPTKGDPGAPGTPKPPRPRQAGFELGLLGLLSFLALAFAGCVKHEPATASPALAAAPQILRLSQRNEPADLDSALVTLPDEFAILRALSEGLLIPGPKGEPQPGAASHFDVSPDGLTYTFHLRPNAVWSNGEPVTSAQFVASYQRALLPATAAPKASVFYPVKNARAFVAGELTDFSRVGFAAPDAHTLVITLARPTPRFPYYVTSGPWLPVPVNVIARNGRSWTRPETFVGNGPFALAEWRQDQRIVVQKNPRWRDAASVRLDEIHFVRFDSGDSEDRAYRAGQIDVTMSVPFSKVEVYARERPAELHRAPMIETRYLAFNCRRPGLQDARVRRALALAIDRAAIVEHVLRGGQPAATTLLPPTLFSEPVAPPVNQLGFEPAEARRLLANAGYPGGRDLPRFAVTAWSPSQVPVLEALQAGWRQELGVEVSLATRDAKVHLSSLMAGDYDIGFVIAIPDVAEGAEILGDFVTGAAENYPHWTEPAFDAALAYAVGLAEPAARTAALREAENILLGHTPLSPIYFNPKIWLMSPRVRGWQEDGLWTRCYQNVYLDEK